MNSNNIYNPLEDGEIRLVKIVETSPIIVCELRTVSIYPLLPAYSALSYVWGDATVTKDIAINGHVFPVTTNLAGALLKIGQQWRRSFPERDGSDANCWFWIDAICINQTDLGEKSSQVPLMALIYLGAELVISWLGPAAAQVHLAFDSFRILANEITGLRAAGEDGYDLQWLKKHPSLCENDQSRLDMPLMGNQRWTSISHMLGAV